MAMGVGNIDHKFKSQMYYMLEINHVLKAVKSCTVYAVSSAGVQLATRSRKSLNKTGSAVIV